MKQLCMLKILLTSPAVYSILERLADSSGGPSGAAGLSLFWPYRKYNCVKNVFIEYLGIIFNCVMYD